MSRSSRSCAPRSSIRWAWLRRRSIRQPNQCRIEQSSTKIGRRKRLPARAVDFSCFAGSGAFVSTPSDLVRFGVFAVLPFVDDAGTIVGLAAIAGVATGFFMPAATAGLPNLVPDEELANANSLALVSAYGTLPIGGAVFTVIVGISTSLSERVPFLGTHPESLALLFDACTFG